MPTYSIQGPDGKTYSIDGPEGATRDQVIAKIKERMSDQRPGALGTLADVGKSLGRGVVKGAIGLAGLPGDIASGLGNVQDWATEAMGFEPPERADVLTSGGMTKGVENVFGEFQEPKTAAGRYAQSIGEAAPSMVMGPEGLIPKVLSTVGSGVGSEFVGKSLEDYGPGAQAVGRIVGGVGGGFAGGLPALRAAGKASKQANAAMADKDAVHAAGSAGYDFINKNNINIAHEEGQDLIDGARATLEERGFDDVNAKMATQWLDGLEGKLFEGTGKKKTPQDLRLSNLMSVYTKLGKVDPGTSEAEAAHIVREHILAWIDENAGGNIPAKLKDAMGNWSAYKKMEELQTAQARANIRTESYGTGQNFQNYMRDEIKKIIDPKFPARAKGYRPEEIAAMKEFVAGSIARNVTRIVGKGLSPASPLGFIRAATESLISTPLAIGTSALGMASQRVGDYLTHKEVEDIIRMVQARAPINKQTGAGARAVDAGRKYRQAQRNMEKGAYAGGVGAFQTNPGDQDQPRQGIPRITVHPRAPADVLANPSDVPDL